MALDHIRSEMRIEEPTLDHYRLDWRPGPGVEIAGMWAPGILTDDSGQSYLGIRGFDDSVRGMTHTVADFCGFRRLKPGLADYPEHIFAEWLTHDWYEAYQYSDSADDVTISFDCGHLRRDASGLHWLDADGRWELHGVPVSKVFVMHIPQQEGIENEVYYRHELLQATGTVEGVSVKGYFHQDFAYGAPGLQYSKLPIVRQLEGAWVSWIHEYADGEIGGSCFWQGREGVEHFRPGYLVKGGETTAHDDFDAKLTFTEAGTPATMHLEVDGSSYDFTFDSIAGPLHVVGPMTASSDGKEIVRSWCWLEYANGLMTPELLDLTDEKFRIARGG